MSAAFARFSVLALAFPSASLSCAVWYCVFCSFFVLCHLALLCSFGWILFAWHWRVVQGREACADLCVGEFSIDVSSDSQVQSALEGGTALEETVVVSEEDHLSCCYGLGSAETYESYSTYFTLLDVLFVGLRFQRCVRLRVMKCCSIFGSASSSPLRYTPGGNCLDVQ